MKSSVAVLVLLCCGVVMSDNEVIDQLHYGDEESIKNEARRTEATISDQQPCQPDIHTVLRELSIKLAEQSVELRYTKNQMSAVEKQLEELKKQNEALSAEIRLKASEKQVEELKRETEGQALELKTLQIRSNVTESQVRELSRENEYKIAFSASLSTEEAVTTTGPFNTDFTLKYTNVFVNIGKAYNPETGIFTAPVRGVYMFRFSISGNGSTSVAVGARLFKNGHHVVIGYCQQPSHRVGTTNGASLLLEVGDVVYVQLYPDTQIFDNVNYHNTFSGQLLFTM
ncbi:cerebellin-1-like [Colossoma macropomum]|uniref:cerebellin-1-like n=1 Tax=Colossoma macropomum TaxID=42526 RepID=UPI0018649D7E|nr:cerebellin-1-like [Colossoma macropomum]